MSAVMPEMLHKEADEVYAQTGISPRQLAHDRENLTMDNAVLTHQRGELLAALKECRKEHGADFSCSLMAQVCAAISKIEVGP